MFDWLKKAANWALRNDPVFRGVTKAALPMASQARRFVPQQAQRYLPTQQQVQQYRMPAYRPPQLDQVAQSIGRQRFVNDAVRNIVGDQGYRNLIKNPSMSQVSKELFQPTVGWRLARMNPATMPVDFISNKVGMPSQQQTMRFLQDKAVNNPATQRALKVPGVGGVLRFAGENIAKPTLDSFARGTDVSAGRQRYDRGVKGLAQAGTDTFNMASMLYAPMKSAAISKAFTQGGLKASARMLPGAFARGVGASAGTNALYQTSERGIKDIDLAQVALSGLMGGVANVGMPLVGPAVGRGVRKATGKGAKALTSQLQAPPPKASIQANKAYSQNVLDNAANLYKKGQVSEPQLRKLAIDNFQQTYGKNPTRADIDGYLSPITGKANPLAIRARTQATGLVDRPAPIRIFGKEFGQPKLDESALYSKRYTKQMIEGKQPEIESLVNSGQYAEAAKLARTIKDPGYRKGMIHFTDMMVDIHKPKGVSAPLPIRSGEPQLPAGFKVSDAGDVVNIKTGKVATPRDLLQAQTGKQMGSYKDVMAADTANLQAKALGKSSADVALPIRTKELGLSGKQKFDIDYYKKYRMNQREVLKYSKDPATRAGAEANILAVNKKIDDVMAQRKFGFIDDAEWKATSIPTNVKQVEKYYKKVLGKNAPVVVNQVDDYMRKVGAKATWYNGLVKLADDTSPRAVSHEFSHHIDMMFNGVKAHRSLNKMLGVENKSRAIQMEARADAIAKHLEETGRGLQTTAKGRLKAILDRVVYQFRRTFGRTDKGERLIESIVQRGRTGKPMMSRNAWEGLPIRKGNDPLDLLRQEARKYKSADEFVKAQGDTYYHGSKTSFDDFKSSTKKGNYSEDQIPGVYMVGDRKIAEMFARDPQYGMSKAVVKELSYKPKKPLVGSPNEIAQKYNFKDLSLADKTKIANLAKRDGYDAIVVKGGINGQDEVIALYPERLKTKQQLTDLYNQATKQNPLPIKVGKKSEAAQATLDDIKISTKPTKMSSNKVEEAKTQFLNRFEPIERFVREKQIELGRTLKPSENPTFYVKQFLGGGGIANYKIDNELTPLIRQTKDFDGLRQYLVGQRMNELAGRGIGKRADKALSQLQKKLGSEKMAEFEGIAQNLYAYQRKQLQELVDVGVLSKQSYNNILAKNQKYIPFQRVLPEDIMQFTQGGQKISGPKMPIKAIKGSDKDIVDPIESMIKNTYDIQATVQKQKVLNSLYELAPNEFKPLGKGVSLKKPAIEMYQNGKRVKYGADPAIARTLNSMDEESMNFVVRAMSLPAKALRSGATSLNVAFALPNIARDQLSAAVNNKYGGIPIYDFVSGLASVIKKDDLYKKWMRTGADQASFFAQDRTTLQRGVKDVTDNALVRLGRKAKNPLELFRIIGDFSEKGSRLGVYKRALKGASKEKGFGAEDIALAAMRESREATIDFAQRGAKMKAFNAMVPFFNARVQGSYKLIQSFKKRPVQTSAIGMGIAGAPAAALFLWNTRPENQKVYDELPDYIKRENFVFVTGREDVPFVKIPKGEIGKIFGNPVESFLAFTKQEDSNWKETAISIADSFLPIGSVSDPARFVTDSSPTAFSVPFQLLANYDAFRDRNIVGEFQKDLPAELQSNRYTTETAKKIGNLLKISPAKFEFGLSGFTGGLGRQALQLGDTLMGKRPPWQEMPVASRFVGEQKDLRNSADDIYKLSEKARLDRARENYQIKDALERGDMSVLQGLDSSRAKSLQRNVAEKQLKDSLTDPTEKALFDLSKEQLEGLSSDSRYASKVAKIMQLKNSLSSGGSKASNPKERYQNALASYNEDKQAGLISDIADISKSKTLRRYQVQANYNQDIVDLYSLSNKELDGYLRKNPNGGGLYKQLQDMDLKMAEAGFTPKYFDKYGRLKKLATGGAKGGGRRKTAKAKKVVPKISFRKTRVSSAPRLKVAKAKKVKFA